MCPAVTREWRLLALIMFMTPLSGGIATEAAAAPDVGTVSAVSGAPQVQNANGRTLALRQKQPLASGAVIVLRSNESIGFCHESAGKIFKVEGAGSVYVGEIGINTEPGGPKVTIIGVCPPSSTPSDTGGVLLRGGIKPPSSPK